MLEPAEKQMIVLRLNDVHIVHDYISKKNTLHEKEKEKLIKEFESHGVR